MRCYRTILRFKPRDAILRRMVYRRTSPRRNPREASPSISLHMATSLRSARPRLIPPRPQALAPRPIQNKMSTHFHHQYIVTFPFLGDFSAYPIDLEYFRIHPSCSPSVVESRNHVVSFHFQNRIICRLVGTSWVVEQSRVRNL